VSWLTAAQAIDALGVRPQTLYANVSRKRIRAKPDPQDPRRSLYHEGDVRKLALKRSGPRRAEEVAAGAMEWGEPVLPSAVSTVADGRLWYRGQDAIALAESRTLEEVAAVLWGASPEALPDSRRRPAAASARAEAVASQRLPGARALSRAFAALAARASDDPPSYGRTQSVLQIEAVDILATLADAMLGPTRAARLHERLAQTWRRNDAADVLRRALVLLADHELNASTFAARVTVSAGASLAAGVLAGLATLTGPLHGRAAVGVRELMDAAAAKGAEVAVRDCLAHGKPIAGFGHPLYPAGDPRAYCLLRQLPLPAEYVEIQKAVEEWVGERPSIDFALAAPTSVYGLPAEAPLIVFSLARSVGWLAHALEQVITGHLIRPRARYVGPPLAA
jgi:citrate synthase